MSKTCISPSEQSIKAENNNPIKQYNNSWVKYRDANEQGSHSNQGPPQSVAMPTGPVTYFEASLT